MSLFNENTVSGLVLGKIGVIPTDTIYGIVGRAEMPDVVEKIYNIRKRNEGKPCIVLIHSVLDLKKFNIEISPEIKKFIEDNKIWPGKVSIVFPSQDYSFDYLSRGTETIAFRIPDSLELLDLLEKTGPLVAPSANTEGEPPAKNIEMAKNYFKDLVDFYVDGGELDSLPSTLIKFENNKLVILREGAVLLKD